MTPTEPREGTCGCAGCRRPAEVELTGLCLFCDDHGYHVHCSQCGTPVIRNSTARSPATMCEACRKPVAP
ncbi:MAG TPA: hypothetical protein VGK67_01500 [Myxococcales bacterium]|jgi:RecJ-like exonuclease